MLVSCEFVQLGSALKLLVHVNLTNLWCDESHYLTGWCMGISRIRSAMGLVVGGDMECI